MLVGEMRVSRIQSLAIYHGAGGPTPELMVWERQLDIMLYKGPLYQNISHAERQQAFPELFQYGRHCPGLSATVGERDNVSVAKQADQCT